VNTGRALRERERAAFTLVEMLVVIGLMAILSSILLVVIASARRMSIRNECQYNLKQIGVALNQIMLESGGAYPLLLEQDDGQPLPWWVRVVQQWEGVAAREGQGAIDTDPAAPGIQLPSQLPHSMALLHCRLAPPLDDKTPAGRLLGLHNSISYGIHFDVMLSDGTPYRCAAGTQVLSNPPTTAADKFQDTYYYTQIRHPGEFILVSEAPCWKADANEDGSLTFPDDWAGAKISMGAISRDATDVPPFGAPIVGRHGGSANVLFADLHVEAMEAVPGETATRNVNANTPLWTLPDD